MEHQVNHDEEPATQEEPDDRYKLRRFATEVELFQSWAAREASKRVTMAWEWAAWAGVVVLAYLVLAFVGLKQITWLDIGCGGVLSITAIGIISYELACARALGRVADPDAAGGAAPEGSPIEQPSTSGGTPALGSF
jgi:hypothetical protein